MWFLEVLQDPNFIRICGQIPIRILINPSIWRLWEVKRMLVEPLSNINNGWWMWWNDADDACPPVSECYACTQETIKNYWKKLELFVPIDIPCYDSILLGVLRHRFTMVSLIFLFLVPSLLCCVTPHASVGDYTYYTLLHCSVRPVKKGCTDLSN